MPSWDKLIYAFEPRIMYDGAIGADLHLSQSELTLDHAGVRAIEAGALAPIAVRQGADPTGHATETNRSQPGDGRETDRERLAEGGSATGHDNAAQARSVVFVQDNIAHYQQLTAKLGQNVDVVVLDSQGDGVHQMAAWAARHSGYRAAYIISHGTDGVIDMGASQLTSRTLGGYARELAAIGRALTPGGDLFVYGCDVAASAKGQMFLSQLSIMTRTDIAASTNLTGAMAEGGDWELEWHNGEIEARSLIDGGAAFTTVLDITQIDFSSYFNADVVYDTSSGSGEFADFDTGGSDGRAFMTQAWAESKYPYNPNGMSNDGTYAANAYHPFVKIAADNVNTGNNAWLVTSGTTGSWNFNVANGNYSTLHLFLSAGGVGPGSNAYFTITLNYTDETSSTTSSMTVRDWFDDFAQSSGTYYLINGMDRMENPSTYNNANDPAIFGFKVDTNQTKTLDSITINITSNAAGYVAFFGATAVSEASTSLPTTVTIPEGGTWSWVNETTGRLTMNEDTSATVSGITIADGEGLSLTTTVTATHGTIDVVNGTGATISNDGTGSVTISGTQDQINATIASLVYTPAANGAGTNYATVTLTTTDGYSSDSVYVIVDVNNINDAPVAVVDTGTATEAGTSAGSTATGNVLTNDTDVDSGDTKTVSAITGGTVGGSTTGTYGTLVLNADGSYTYTIDDANTSVQALRTSANTLTDTFTYTMRDTAGVTSSTTLTVTVRGQNDAPVGVADTDTAAEAGTSAGSTANGNVLTNDTDVDSGDTKTVSAITGGTVGGSTTGTYGTLVLNANGSYTYTIDDANTTVQALRTSAETLTDTFTYTVRDTSGATSSTTLSVTITGQNDAPVAALNTGAAIEAGGTHNASPGATATGNVLTNDTDVDSGDTKIVSAITGGTVGGSTTGTYGTLVLNADGSYTYTIDDANTTVQALRTSAETLTDTFTYTVRDTSGATSSTTLSVTITGQNDAPVAALNTGAAIEAGGTHNASPGATATGNVLGNATDVDAGDAIVVSAVTGGTVGGSTTGTYGTLVLNADGSYTYTIDDANSAVEALRTSAETLTDTFTYTVRDIAGATSSATLAITISGQNDTPVTGTDSLVLDWNGGGVKTEALTNSFTDADGGETFVYTLPATAPNWLSIATDGTISGTIPTGSTGVADFSVSITDSAGNVLFLPVSLSYSNPAASGPSSTPIPGERPTHTPVPSEGYVVPSTIVSNDQGSSTPSPGMATESTQGYGSSGTDSGSVNGTSNAQLDLVASMPASSSGFEVALVRHTAGHPDELIVNEHLTDQGVTNGQPVRVFIPHDAFAHTNAEARVALTVELDNGSPLPSWLSFNSQTGVISGVPPQGFSGEVLLKVTAKDNNGLEATQTFRLVIGDNTGALVVRPAPETTGALSFQAGHGGGHPGFSEQMKLFNGQTQMADSARLMAALSGTHPG